MAESTRGNKFVILVRNLALAGLLYGSIFAAIELSRDPSLRARGKLGIPSLLKSGAPADVLRTTRDGVQVKFAGAGATVTVNPHANVFNRPESGVVPADDFLGPRPHVDTEADLQLLVEECRGSAAGIERMRDVHACLRFLARDEHRYYHLPEPSHRASAQDPREAEYNDADGHGNTRDAYVSPGDAAPASASSLGTCPGPIIPYHVYWTGPATWRVEAFVKAYLHTQNLACSRLWLWLDADRSPSAVDDMLRRDTLFARFLPLVERGDIRLMAWRFPARIPLPRGHDHTDGRSGGAGARPRPDARGEVPLADNVVEDAAGAPWLALTARQMTFLPVAVSDAVRFVVLHLHGGVYLDMDVLLLRDMRPLLLRARDHAFAERWAAHPHPGDYNTAILSLTANSSLSSYLLRGGVRMGLNFHPRVVGRMAWKDGRNGELAMLETAAFDPVWTEFNRDRTGPCAVPCLRDYAAAFKGRAGAVPGEWRSFDGAPLERLDLAGARGARGGAQELRPRREREEEEQEYGDAQEAVHRESGADGDEGAAPEGEGDGDASDPADSFAATGDEERALRTAGVVADYVFAEDRFPPNNRTMADFFRGAWTYHVHNQWMKHPEPSSWLHVLQTAHDGFLAGRRTNPYGERWTGPSLTPYNYWPEYV